ncbi:MAG: YqeG family HAD IIIA-type phosphatase [Bacilli bacterium]|nr:YqeG family HAD IIIA-type phosphatase [Bacilli bacterium]
MEKFLPDIYQKSIYTIDYSKLLNHGIKCLLFDLDNTIAPPNTRQVSQKTKDLFISLKQKGFKVIIFSNSLKFRVKHYQKQLDVDAYSNARKPFSGKFQKVMKDYGYNITELAIIGDQLLTDIKGGNKIGITTILVNPISKKDHIYAKITRKIENRIMNKMHENNIFSKGKYYD